MTANIDRHEIDLFLQERRKHRDFKACYPCRQRKVKCDNTQPCRTCRRRGHPQICTYDIENAARRKFNRTSTSPVEQQTGTRLPVSSPTTQDNLQQHESSTATSTSIYSGDNSVMSILRHRTHDNESMAREVGSVLGLQNTYSSYPFMDARTTKHRWEDLLQIVPQRAEVLRFFQAYRQSAYLFNPILVDIDQFELDLCSYLSAHAAGEFQDTSTASTKWTTDRSIGYISLLLATLSAGAHYSDLELPQRSEICQNLARRSFHALRLANFLFSPSFDIVQTLLVLGNTLQNNGQSDAAWAQLGTTVRLAQTLGLHTERSAAHLPVYMRPKAKALWSAIVWQDSLLSLCYDRPPVVSITGWSFGSEVSPGCSLSYTDVMHRLSRLGLEITTASGGTEETTHRLKILNALDDLYQQAQPHLRSRENCKSMQNTLENLALKTHISLAVLVLTRPVIKHIQDTGHAHDILLKRAKESLLDASRVFLEFQALSFVPLRTWSMVHTVLSSTLLLCIWEGTRNDRESRDLQQRVINVFLEGGLVGSCRDSVPGESQWLSTRHIKTLIELRNAVGSALDREGEGEGHNPVDNPIASETYFPLPLFDMNQDFGGDSGQLEASPISLFDSIMNVPLFDFSQNGSL